MTTFLRIAVVSAIAACGGTGGDPARPAAPDTLYLRLGGEPGVKAVVKDFVEENVAKDARINAYFTGTDLPRLEKLLVEQICNVTGGGCTYRGKDMKTAHARMNVKDADFAALVEDLARSLDKFKVRDADKRELLKAFGAMKGDIVTAG